MTTEGKYGLYVSLIHAVVIAIWINLGYLIEYEGSKCNKKIKEVK